MAPTKEAVIAEIVQQNLVRLVAIGIAKSAVAIARSNASPHCVWRPFIDESIQLRSRKIAGGKVIVVGRKPADRHDR